MRQAASVFLVSRICRTGRAKYRLCNVASHWAIPEEGTAPVKTTKRVNLDHLSGSTAAGEALRSFVPAISATTTRSEYLTGWHSNVWCKSYTLRPTPDRRFTRMHLRVRDRQRPSDYSATLVSVVIQDTYRKCVTMTLNGPGYLLCGIVARAYYCTLFTDSSALPLLYVTDFLCEHAHVV